MKNTELSVNSGVFCELWNDIYEKWEKTQIQQSISSG